MSAGGKAYRLFTKAEVAWFDLMASAPEAEAKFQASIARETWRYWRSRARFTADVRRSIAGMGAANDAS